jgi:hypothetical protein
MADARQCGGQRANMRMAIDEHMRQLGCDPEARGGLTPVQWRDSLSNVQLITTISPLNSEF